MRRGLLQEELLTCYLLLTCVLFTSSRSTDVQLLLSNFLQPGEQCKQCCFFPLLFLVVYFFNRILLCISLTLLLGHRLKLSACVSFFFLVVLLFVTLLNSNLANLLRGSRPTHCSQSFLLHTAYSHAPICDRILTYCQSCYRAK